MPRMSFMSAFLHFLTAVAFADGAAVVQPAAIVTSAGNRIGLGSSNSSAREIILDDSPGSYHLPASRKRTPRKCGDNYDEPCRIVFYDPRPIGESVNSKRDFYTKDFSHYHERDLSLIKELGANMVMLRAWDYNADHSGFLGKCKDKHLKVMVTFSVYEYVFGDKGREQAANDAQVFNKSMQPYRGNGGVITAVTVDVWPLLQDVAGASKYFDLVDLIRDHVQFREQDLGDFVLPLNLDPDRFDKGHENFSPDKQQTALKTWFADANVAKHINKRNRTWMLQIKASVAANKSLILGLNSHVKTVADKLTNNRNMSVDYIMLGIDRMLSYNYGIEIEKKSDGTGQINLLKTLLDRLAENDKYSTVVDEFMDNWDRSRAWDYCSDGQFVHNIDCGFKSTYSEDLIEQRVAVERLGLFLQYSWFGFGCLDRGWNSQNLWTGDSQRSDVNLCVFDGVPWHWCMIAGACAVVSLLLSSILRARKACVSANEATHTFKGDMGAVCGDDGIVQEVIDDSPAQRKGIKQGHKIVKVDGNPFSNERLINAANSRSDYIVIVGKMESCNSQRHEQQTQRPAMKRAEISVTMPTFHKVGGQRFSLALKTCRLHKDDAYMYLKCHLDVQQERLDRQIYAEEIATQAIVESNHELWTPKGIITFDGSEDQDKLIREAAIRIIHARALEAYFAWSEMRASTLKENTLAFTNLMHPDREPWMMYAETILVRMLESLGEHVMQAPERMSQIMHRVRWGGSMEPPERESGDIREGQCFEIDYEDLQDGLDDIDKNANPYEGNINFDDMNECGRVPEFPDARQSDPMSRWPKRMRKTYQESVSIMVVLDFIRTFRSMIFVKFWLLALAGYIHYGSWVLQWWAFADSVALVVMELVVLVFDKAQRKIGLGLHCAPTCRDKCEYLATHVGSIVLGAVGVVILGGLCDQSLEHMEGKWWPFLDDSEDELKAWLLPLGYLAVRLCTMPFLAWGRSPMLLLGTPQQRPSLGASSANRPKRMSWQMSFQALAIWFFILAVCCWFEVKLLFPMAEGVTFTSMCDDVCSSGWTVKTMFRSDCFACRGAVFLVWVMLVMTATIDVWFVFNVFLSVFGTVQGFMRGLNGVRSTELRDLDFTSDENGDPIEGSDGDFMQRVFGSEWKTIWSHIIEDLFVDCYLSDEDANALVHAAQAHRANKEDNRPSPSASFRISRRSLNFLTQMAKERLSFFFASLRTIANARKYPMSEGHRLSDSHIGTIPSLTAVIPAYNEVVMCSVKYLRASDTVGTNLHFLRSQFDVEWDLLARRLGRHPDELENKFIHENFGDTSPLDLTEVNEVRRWATMRAQTVGKTVIGAVAYMQALWSGLSKIRTFYNDSLKTQAYEFNPGAMGVSYDDNGVVTKVFDKGQAQGMNINEKDRIVKIGDTAYSKDAVANAERSGSNYQVTLVRTRVGTKRLGVHCQLVLAHQTYGQTGKGAGKEVLEDNEQAIRTLMHRYKKYPVQLICDFDYKKTKKCIKEQVEDWMQKQYQSQNRNYVPGSLKYAGVKLEYDESYDSAEGSPESGIDHRLLKVVHVVPRSFKMRIGPEDFLTQGKASNQLNGFRFAYGLYVQAMDANMGCSMAEAFKVPFALRRFQPSWLKDRSKVAARLVGFREFIFTGLHGAVGKSHALAEWVFGTIYQRFMTGGIGMRMHYGHPDFVDGFWAQNRGSMSKASTQINLNEDLFAGMNVLHRNERSTHIDFLEFEKGREATVNAAANFFAKIGAGNVAIMRSRDLRLIAEKVGFVHTFSAYFTACAFYLTNVFVDITIYIYVYLFVAFNLGQCSLEKVHAHSQPLAVEWMFSMGLFNTVLQLFETVLEYGSLRTLVQVVPMIPHQMIFFIFQNKTIASSVKDGATTGQAKYQFTGRPHGNNHQTWIENYTMYYTMHFYPALRIFAAYGVLRVLSQNDKYAMLPMYLIVSSAIGWLVCPVLYSAQPRWHSMVADIREMAHFVIALPEEGREADFGGFGKTDDTLYGLWLSRELRHLQTSTFYRFFTCLLSCGTFAIAFVSMHSQILNYTYAFFVVLCMHSAICVIWRDSAFKIVEFVLFIGWPLAFFVIVPKIAGSNHGSGFVFVAAVVFTWALDVVKQILQLLAWLIIRPAKAPDSRSSKLYKSVVETLYVHLFLYHRHQYAALLIMVAHFCTNMVLILLEKLGGFHSWFMLNGNLRGGLLKPLIGGGLGGDRAAGVFPQRTAALAGWQESYRTNSWKPPNGEQTESFVHQEESGSFSFRRRQQESRIQQSEPNTRLLGP